MAGNRSKGLCAATVLSITIVGLAGGCSHPRSTPKDAAAASNGVSQVSQALVGKQITISGKFSLGGKEAPYILLDNQEELYLEPDMSKGSFTWGKPYSDMDGKLVTATGILRFSKAPPAVPTPRPVQRAPDFYYFDLETTQLRLIDH